MEFAMSEVLILIVVTIIIIWWRKSNSKLDEFYRKLKSPPGLPFLGNALELTSSKTFLDVLTKYTKNCGDIIRLNIGPIRKIIVISNYELLAFILSNTKLTKKSSSYEYFRQWLGDGLLISKGLKWKKFRRILTPAFHFKILEEFVEIFESTGEILVEKFQDNQSPSIDIYPLVTLCALDIICETAMGTNVNAQKDSTSPYVKSVKEMGRIIIDRSIRLLEIHDYTYIFTKNYRTEKEALSILHSYTNNVISRRKEERQKNHGKLVNELGIKKKQAFLDCLLDATVDGRPLTQEEIRQEVDTFMFEGHDTTSSGISFVLYCIATYSEVQKKVVEEQKLIFGSLKDCKASYTDLMQMKYLDKVIKETLRLYPSVPVIGRETDSDQDFNGLLIPEGVFLLLFIYEIQRNPKYFPNPEDFIPERYDEIDGTKPFSYIPFSAGPRNCIGQKFAVLEMKSVVSKIVRNFELFPAFPAHTLQLVAETILKSDNGIRIGIRTRN